MIEPISVGLKFGFLAVLYLFLLWVSRSALKDLRRPTTPVAVPAGMPASDATGLHAAVLPEGAAARSGLPAWQIDDMYGMFPRLKERQHVQAGVLSGGEQQMLTLCRSLLGNPELIMIDEPTEDALGRALVAMVGTPATAASHRALGLLRATEFSWARAARSVEAAYLEALAAR